MTPALVNLRNRLRATVDAFVPDVIGDQVLGVDAQRRSRFLVWGSFGVALAFTIVIAARWLFVGYPGQLFPLYLIDLAMLCGAPFMLRATRSLRVAGLVPAVATAISIPVAAMFNGGPHAPAVAWMPLIPLLAGFFAGRRMGAWFTCIAVCEGLVMLLAQLTGFQFQSELDPEHQKRITVVALIFCTMIAGGLTYAFETQRWRIEQDRQAIYVESIRDSLTLTYNRRYFEQRMSEEIAYAKRHRAPLSLLLLDVDNFKRINDEHGHAAGDAVLRELVARLQRTLRNEDILARYGGEEFVVALRGTAGEGARLAAERLRKVIEDGPIRVDHGSIACTISVGCAVLALDGTEPISTRALLDTADRRLYISKKSGRNRVTAQDG